MFPLGFNLSRFYCITKLYIKRIFFFFNFRFNLFLAITIEKERRIWIRKSLKLLFTRFTLEMGRIWKDNMLNYFTLCMCSSFEFSLTVSSLIFSSFLSSSVTSESGCWGLSMSFMTVVSGVSLVTEYKVMCPFCSLSSSLMSTIALLTRSMT